MADRRVGGVISGASPAYNVEEMTYALKTGQAKYLMTVPSSLDVAVPAAQNAGIPPERIFLLDGEKEGYTTVQQLIEMGQSYGPEGQVAAFSLPPGKTNAEICGFLSFSSGTTGLPKAVRTLPASDSIYTDPHQVMISHHNVIAQCMQVQQVTAPDHKRSLAVLPLFHSKTALPMYW